MTPTPIRNTHARDFWCDRYAAGEKIVMQPGPRSKAGPTDYADAALDEFAARFGDAQLIEDIAANKARRGQG